jgi:chromosomal replication initiation ATPase DnaA
MLLKDTFEKEIDRPIDPVVKASQTDDAHLANELDEFVVTNEVKQHLLDFLDAYNDPDSVGNGAWISGFFGSGKSHLLKILAVALENRDVEDKDGTVKPALNYLIPKVSDMPALKSAMEVVPKSALAESWSSARTSSAAL